MTTSLAHRGPDADGFWTDEELGIGLGHRRLSIVDLSPTGAQPMASHDGRWVIAFNGEIYNYREIRERLGGASVEWRGSSDTEVLLAAISAWGLTAALDAIAGMYAIALWDRAEARLHLVRDRLGEKPLYVGVADGVLAFGSELKAVLNSPGFPRRARPSAIASLLRRGYVAGTESILEDVQRVAPGAHLTVERTAGGFAFRERRYWSIAGASASARLDSPPANLSAAADALDTLLREVIASEMVADVPVGAFLSGGIDSSLVVALMQRQATAPVRTFTVAFSDAGFDESAFAARVAKHLGTEHSEHRLHSADALQFVARLPTLYDEPLGDSSQLPTLLVSRVAREQVTVALSGDAGDELFGGYTHYRSRDSLGSWFGRVPALLRPATRALAKAAPDALYERLFASSGTWGRNARARVLRGLQSPHDSLLYEDLMANWVEPHWLLSVATESSGRDASAGTPFWPKSGAPAMQRMIYDMQTYLPDDILVKVDRAAMACSLETRAPLLHHRVVEFALALPLEFKIGPRGGKLVLRELLARYVPTELFERPKQGFAIPLADWLRGPLREWGEAQLADDEVTNAWFARERILTVWAEHLRGVRDHSYRLWPLLTTLQWLRHWGMSRPNG